MTPDREPIRVQPPTRTRRAAVFVVAAGVLAAGLAVVQLATRSRLDAAEVQLDRLIAAVKDAGDRTYRIGVLDPESSVAFDPNQPSMEGALLHVRGQREYVLARRVGFRSFVTGSNGSESWSIPAEGPVRVSADPRRFRGALPGEQQDLPFVELSSALARLREAYRLELSGEDDSPTRQLRARKRSASHRGPRGVYIDFDTASGVIRRMRLEGLPQARGGPRGLSLELVSQNDLGPDFFEHEAHHDSDRRVVHGD